MKRLQISYVPQTSLRPLAWMIKRIRLLHRLRSRRSRCVDTLPHLFEPTHAVFGACTRILHAHAILNDVSCWLSVRLVLSRHVLRMNKNLIREDLYLRRCIICLDSLKTLRQQLSLGYLIENNDKLMVEIISNLRNCLFAQLLKYQFAWRQSFSQVSRPVFSVVCYFGILNQMQCPDLISLAL